LSAAADTTAETRDNLLREREAMAEERTNRGWRRDSGASAVEMAIVLPLLVLLVFGIIDFGRMLNAQIEISQAAREGVRLAALTEGNTAYAGMIPARVTQAAPNPGFQGGAATVVGSPVICPNASSLATVTAGYHFTGIFWRVGSGVDLRQTAVMRCGG
jgi:Flp pilus assembly protein TadG